MNDWDNVVCLLSIAWELFDLESSFKVSSFESY